MPLALGSRLGNYQILSAIGAGGMGEVYKARDTRLDRDVAVKILPNPSAADANRIGRFHREAKTLAALNHPNIGTIHRIEEADGVIGIVMELVEGEDLSERIARGRIPLEETLAVGRQIVDGARELTGLIGHSHRWNQIQRAGGEVLQRLA